MKILDVGSGIVDVYADGEVNAFDNPNAIHLDISKNSYHLDVQGSVFNLPFNDKSFDVVLISHLLEHLEHPLAALKEIKRVARHKVVVKVPNASYFKFKSECSNHFFSWNPSTLEHLLRLVFDSVAVKTSRRYNPKRNYIKKLVFAVACLFLKENEVVAVCRC